MSHILSFEYIFNAEDFGRIIITRAICQPFLEPKSCFHSHHLNQNSEKLPDKFIFFFL